MHHMGRDFRKQQLMAIKDEGLIASVDVHATAVRLCTSL